uniref:Uncharacterized protein n=1 Tax=Rhizophora mucronata TaxID=61149 RepID=A0A2P2QGA8_RHIMU
MFLKAHKRYLNFFLTLLLSQVNFQNYLQNVPVNLHGHAREYTKYMVVL